MIKAEVTDVVIASKKIKHQQITVLVRIRYTYFVFLA